MTKRRVALAVLLAGCLHGPPTARVSTGEIDTSFLKDFAETRSYRLGRPVGPLPTPEGTAILFLRSPARRPLMHLYEMEVATGRVRLLATPEDILRGGKEELSPEEKARRERQRISHGGFVKYDLSPAGDSVLLPLSGKLYLLSRRDRRVRELPLGEEAVLDPRFSPDGRRLAYVKGFDLHVLDLDSGRETRLTTGGTRDLSYGLAEFVAQEEMDRHAGYWWSSDSRWIAYEEADARDVELWHVANPASPGARPFPHRYPRPGKNNVKVRVGVTGAEGGETRWLTWDRGRWPYLVNVKWQKGGPLTLVVQDRAQREMAVLAADPQSGATTLLLLERDDAWVNIDPRVPRWLPDGSGFLWTSESAGAWRLELRDPRGGLVRVLVPPEAGFAGLRHVSGGYAYYRAGIEPVDTQLWRVSLRDARAERLSAEPGLHDAVFRGGSPVHLRLHVGLRSLGRWTVHRRDGTLAAELPSVALSPPFEPTTRIVRADDLYCAITRPRALRAGDRYPVVVEVYGGPHNQMVVPIKGRYLKTQWLADQGFLVTSCDGRGTPRRGRAWERAIRGSFGRIPLEDQVRGLRALAKRFPEMDLARVGITGWSFGGYLAALAVLREPSVFHAAVAGAPVVDWLDYDTHYTERYLGLPAENPDGYRESSLLTHAPGLERPLLLLHGTADDNVFFLHTLKLSQALFLAGKPHGVLPLPGLTHMLPSALVRQRIEERVVRFFRERL
jgi:dipeptidyl-peptidase-4